MKIEYDYNDKNLKNFVDDLYEQLKTDCFKNLTALTSSVTYLSQH